MPAKKSSKSAAPKSARKSKLETIETIQINAPKIGRIEIVNNEPRWLVPVGAILPDPANTNTHPPRSIQAIRGSLRRFGQTKPLVLRPDMTIIAGSGTFLAALEEGWSEVWVTQSGLDGVEATAYGIADNRAAELSQRDDDAIEKIMREMAAENHSLDGMGFDDVDLASLLSADNTASNNEGDGQAGERGLNPNQEQERFLSSGVKQIAFYVLDDIYPEIADKLDAILTARNLESHSDVFLFCLNTAHALIVEEQEREQMEAEA